MQDRPVSPAHDDEHVTRRPLHDDNAEIKRPASPIQAGGIIHGNRHPNNDYPRVADMQHDTERPASPLQNYQFPDMPNLDDYIDEIPPRQNELFHHDEQVVQVDVHHHKVDDNGLTPLQDELC